MFARRACRKNADPRRITLLRNTISGNQGRVIPGRSDANCGNYDQYIDASDDQAPFNQ